MTELNQNNPAAACGGTATAPTDLKSACGSVQKADKRRAFILLGAAGVTLAALLLSRLVWLAAPLFDKILYGTVTEITYYLILTLIVVGYAIGLNKFLKKFCDFKLFERSAEKISITRALGAIALCAVFMFIASAAIGFKFKMELEIGYGVTPVVAISRVATYIYYAEHLLLGFIMATLVQNALSTLVPTRYELPWGAIALVTVYGLIEFVLELYATTHLYPWIYYLFTYAYAAIYVLTGRSFRLSYWASVILMVL